ncbi:MAG: hypothetical protein GX600_07565 [Dehalococcoidia bacterium]|nr:hypothetical protein [Dehalococcoidia bacterium]
MQSERQTKLRPSSDMKASTPIRAIRAQCIDCCCGSKHEVELCPAVECALWSYRFGVRPETAAAQGKAVDRKQARRDGVTPGEDVTR